MAVPKYDELFSPTMQALHELGGSGSIEELEETVAQILSLSDREINEKHRGNRTKLAYNSAWARYYLKRFGLIENSSRGVWAITKKGYKTRKIDPEAIKKYTKGLDEQKVGGKRKREMVTDAELWKEELLAELMGIDPKGFEILCQRILRESGFFEVEVTGHPGDGGIDGKGKVRIGGLISFQVIFQCKRYKTSVGAKEIRDFRGTMSGRTDKGLFITTGNFTREAKREASREGATFIDLVDGNLLVEKMKELGLGVRVEQSEKVEVDREWFKTFR